MRTANLLSIRSVWAASVVALLIFVVPSLSDFSGCVIGVTDGDTVTVMSCGRAKKVRLYGVDCPERAQPFGTQAKKATSALCFNATVKVRVRDTDRYGRTVGIVILPNGKGLSKELVRRGCGWWYRKYAPNDKALMLLELNAQRARRGLWKDPNPIPPWEFRRNRKERKPQR